jgi:hypothetical protein
VAELLDRRGQAELVERRDGGVHPAGDQGELAPLLENIHPEPALVVPDDVGEVSPAVLVHLLAGLVVHDRPDQLLHHVLGEDRGLHPLDDAPQPHHARLAGLQVQVRPLVHHDRAE